MGQISSNLGSVPSNLYASTPSGPINYMSVYQPFPLRIDGQQYDACFQIGDFSLRDGKDTNPGIVVLIPLNVDSNPGKGGKFVNAFASSIPSILGGTPDRMMGFPDVQVTGLTDWSVADILHVDRPFYTWKTKDGTRVIVMAEAIGIAEGDMTNIKSLPITPPSHVIHEIPEQKYIFYKAAPPLDCAGNPIKCKKPFTIVPVEMPKQDSSQKASGMNFLNGLGTFIAVVFAVWFAIMLATGPGATLIKRLGEGIGGTFNSAPTRRIMNPLPPEARGPVPAA